MLKAVGNQHQTPKMRWTCWVASTGILAHWPPSPQLPPWRQQAGLGTIVLGLAESLQALRLTSVWFLLVACKITHHIDCELDTNPRYCLVLWKKGLCKVSLHLWMRVDCDILDTHTLCFCCVDYCLNAPTLVATCMAASTTDCIYLHISNKASKTMHLVGQPINT